MLKPLEMAHAFLAEILTKNDYALDATMGNGHDTVFLAKRAKEVFAFDVQFEALQNTRNRADAEGLDNVRLFWSGHQNINHYILGCKVAIFNLGYLPNGDKSITTRYDTTIDAIEQVLNILSVGGRVSIVIYPGHEVGKLEKVEVLDYVSALDQNYFTVMLYEPLNQINTPPLLVMIEKIKSTDDPFYDRF